MISSTAKYASVGMPTVCGRTSTMTMTGRAMNLRKRSLISRSDARSLGPVWYQPIIRSRAGGEGESAARGTGSATHGPLTFLNMSNMPSM